MQDNLFNKVVFSSPLITVELIVMHEFFHVVASPKHIKLCHVFISPNTWSVLCPRWFTKRATMFRLILPFVMVSVLVFILFLITSSLLLFVLFLYINIEMSSRDILSFIGVAKHVPKNAWVFHAYAWYQQ